MWLRERWKVFGIRERAEGPRLFAGKRRKLRSSASDIGWMISWLNFAEVVKRLCVFCSKVLCFFEGGFFVFQIYYICRNIDISKNHSSHLYM